MRLLEGPLGGLILRPWFDRLALRFMVGTYFPISRLWAATETAGDDVTEYAANVPMDVPNGSRRARLQSALAHTMLARVSAEQAELDWQDAMFSGSDGDHLRDMTARRRQSVGSYMMARTRFRFLRRHAPAIRFATITPDDAQRRYGAYRDDPASFFASPADPPAIDQSHAVTAGGFTHTWLRFPSPNAAMGDTVWAHVFEPPDGYDHTAIICHGIGIEADMWDSSLHFAPQFAGRRVRVIEPEAPWHGRRRPPGVHGGEPFVAHGPIGAVEEFQAHLAEIACLIGWARATGPGRVAIGGISMGALNSQLAVAHAGTWPEAMRPDAALLITTTDRLDEVACDGSFAAGFHTAEAFAEAGWSREQIHDWMPLTAPIGEPGIDPDRIIMMQGSHDTITPFPGGLAFAQRWGIPDENLFIRRQGHFSVPLGLARDASPVARLVEILNT